MILKPWQVGLLLLWVGSAAYAQGTPPGSPKPSVGAPGDKPGQNDPFGSQGEKAEEQNSQAEAVAENRQPVVVSIEVEGNKKTRLGEVKRHLVIEEGDELDEDKILISRVRLLQFGAFDSVDAQVVHAASPNAVKLIFKVHERNSVFVTDLVYGSTAFTRHYGVLGIADANFLGVGLGVAGQVLLGADGQHGVRLSLYQADFQINDVSFVMGLQGVHIRGRENACGGLGCFETGPELRYERNGGQISVGVRSSSYERFLLGYRYEVIDSNANPDASAYQGPYVLPGRTRLSALSGSFDRDARNDTFLPTRGSRIQFSITLGTRALGSDYDYSRYLLQLEKWIPQGGGRAFRLDAAAGIVQGRAPFFERFYAADWSYFSVGYAVSRLLEMNLSPDPRYDTILALVGAEYDFPLWNKPHVIVRRGYLALGARATWTEAYAGAGRTPLSRSPFSFDVSLRIDTKYGLFNVSLAYLGDLIL